jgi:hypothetical protein
VRRRSITTLLAALAVSLPAALLAGPHTPAQATPDSSGGGTSSSRTITLLTGDRVTVDSRGRAAVEPAEGREDIVFATQRVDGHVRVIPSDAELLLARGRIDARLFDVTALIGMGYDDRGRADLPLIVTHDKGETLTGRGPHPGHDRTQAAGRERHCRQRAQGRRRRPVGDPHRRGGGRRTTGVGHRA